MKVDKGIEHISVVGFPKSGNTWLTRLLADLLSCPVHQGAMRGNPEIAAEINQRLPRGVDSKFDVRKEHFLPTSHFNEVDEVPTRIVYIYRDVRDVLISAFFYKTSYKETDVQTRDYISLLFTPHAAPRYWNCRRKLFKYVKQFSAEGWGGPVGDWSQHITEWRNEKRLRSDIAFAFVSYEELLIDTTSTILRILHELELPIPSDKHLQDVVERQSFIAQKQHFEKLPDIANVPLGKEFNVKFLRKGVAGDWRNFLSCRMGRVLHKHQGETLIELGYESDPGWYEKIIFDM
ncbi:sulfotransferase domain-containing protein [Thermodesulfobacteriota bacterium]